MNGGGGGGVNLATVLGNGHDMGGANCTAGNVTGTNVELTTDTDTDHSHLGSTNKIASATVSMRIVGVNSLSYEILSPSCPLFILILILMMMMDTDQMVVPQLRNSGRCKFASFHALQSLYAALQ